MPKAWHVVLQLLDLKQVRLLKLRLQVMVYFVEYGNLDKLQDGILNTLRDRNSFKTATECAAYAANMFSKRKMVQFYLAEYNSLYRARKVSYYSSPLMPLIPYK